MDNFDSFYDRQEIINTVAWICWHIWKARNDQIFNHVPVNPKLVIDKAVREALEFEATQFLLVSSSTTRRQTGDVNRAWAPPTQGSLKVNCDVMVNSVSKGGVVAVLMRNAQGKLIDRLVREVAITSVFQGEALVLRLACVMCDALNLNWVEIEGDNQRAIKLCVFEDVPPWECATIYADLRALAHRCELTFSWCPWSANSTAHWTAQARLGGSLPANWVACPLPCLVTCLTL
ncbi:hypothetical protein LOK49_LG03G02684 [Camellia lanceoleosa]|uniref:Uncharacterized protein n=1 Tax=Camellia lanceoleosa TaxID=1840588 RepID=A0ACC0IF02_9ERIC|nr:hypothetical protein LOK49_LG03G02684 [Camellia lanceoleosa]